MNIEEHRQPWESDEHWVFRKEFLTIHKGKFSDDRLLCLAQVFANIELLGCNYPAPVMRQVNQLASAITNLEDLRRKRLEKATVKFIKGEENNSGVKRKLASSSSNSVKYIRTENCELEKSSYKHSGIPSYNTVESKNVTSHYTQKGTNTGSSFDQRVENTYISHLDGNIRDMPNQTFDWMNAKKNKIGLNEGIAKSLPIHEKFKMLIEDVKKKAGKSQNPFGLLNASCMRTFCKLVWKSENVQKSNNPLGNFGASLNIDGVQIAYVVGFKRKEVKLEVTRAAISALLNPNFHLVEKTDGSFQASTEMEEIINNEMEIDSIDEMEIDSIADYTECKNPNMDSDQSLMNSNSDFSALASVVQKRLIRMSELIKVQEFKQPNVLSLVQVTSSKASMKVSFSVDMLSSPKNLTKRFMSRLFLDGVLVGSGRGENQKNAKINAYTDGISRIKQSSIKILSNPHGVLELVRSDDPVSENPGPMQTGSSQIVKEEMGTTPQNNDDVQELLLISDLGVRDSANYVTAVRQSADFNRVPCQFEISHLGQGKQQIIRCQVIIGGKLYGEANSLTLKTVKADAAKIAWGNMQKRFYTVQMKCLVASEGGQQISVDSLFGKEKNKALTEDNIGFKMLQMMGWKEGGGVGKGGTGITQPVSVQDVYKREGIGFERGIRNMGNFRKGLEGLIRKYAESDNSYDLSFSAEFSKEERKIIHRIAEKYHLRNSCIGGKGPNRRVILSRRFRPQELLQHLMKSGGSTNKYELISPKP